ncbi:uncharacterized protein A1O9_12315 [Exophiala aquamarina CBS 119918]|uniref:Glutamate-1-semialdehyde 2,1-aminomutase n=1 Tax=Exophiala aquamarina CBS 119918 TaxID=1182545 RepID=A0A072P7U5_9EURO|nr:uncharacterized protein A1O9_12315 [Exophiala aquamarina CBS 119918]KEF51680.1 hypothetical protein A1O9_12315 [Exophiala aquamarina CBS 119918]
MGSLSTPDSTVLQAALEEAHTTYTNSNSLSRKLNREAAQFLPGGNTRTVLHATPFPLTVSSGSGPTLTTLDGHTYVDFLGEYTAGIYGHSHPVIKAALQDALEKGWNYGAHNALEAELARIITDRFPALELVRFVNSGTEANMMALATALAYTGKKKVLVFEKGYHGSTISGRTPSTKKSINLPHDFLVATYNDLEGTRDLIDSLPNDSLAAILIEPMLGSGGCYPATHEFLALLRRLATENKALLIFDEVMTSRLTYHGLGAVTGVTPDLMTLGKWVGGGMSFGLFGGRRDIMQLYDPRSGSLEHPGTFNNNIFTMSAGVAGCNFLTADKIDALNHLGDVLRSKVEDIFTARDISSGTGAGTALPTRPVTDDMHSPSHPQRPPKMFIRGVGSLNAIHFVGPDRDVLQGLFYHHMLQNGIFMAQRGFTALNVLITDEHVDAFVRAVDAFVGKWEASLRW